MSKFGKDLERSLKDALAFTKGEGRGAIVHSVELPNEHDPDRVARIIKSDRVRDRLTTESEDYIWGVWKSCFLRLKRYSTGLKGLGNQLVFSWAKPLSHNDVACNMSLLSFTQRCLQQFRQWASQQLNKA